MLYGLSRVLQLVGLFILPFAISGNVADRLNLRESLALSSVGIFIFFLGWLLQQATRPK